MSAEIISFESIGRNFDTKKFITQVQSRTALWDTTTEGYSNRDLKRRGWKELTNIFINNEEATEWEKNEFGRFLMRKWKSLRDCYSRERQRLAQIKSGLGVSRKSQYVFYNQLSFLQRVMKSKNISSNVEEKSSASSSISNIKRRPFKRKKEETMPPKTLLLKDSIHTLKEREYMKENYEKDEDELFLLSLLSSLKKIPEHLRISVRTQMMQVIDIATRTNLNQDLLQQSNQQYCFNYRSQHSGKPPRSKMSIQPVVLVHGGAGDITSARIPAKIRGVKEAARTGYEILQSGGSVVDAVEAAVRCMEDGEAFNAGYGSVLNVDGEVEMDASIMIGSSLNAGAVTIVKDIAHPISLARLVMEKTPHVLLGAEGAKRFAVDQGVPILPPGSLVSKHALEALENFKLHGGDLTEIGPETNKGEVGTVGAVAVDENGHVAAATSTGGMSGKMVGRSSDTSQIGSGTYADDNSGAVSTTGHGETILKFCLAHAITTAMENGKSASEATIDAINMMTARLNNTAGAITVSKTGQVGISWSSRRMAWAYQRGDELHYGIEQNESEMEKVKNE